MSGLPSLGNVLPDPERVFVFLVVYGGPLAPGYAHDPENRLLAFEHPGLADGFRFRLERRGVESPAVVRRSLRDLRDYVADLARGPDDFVLFEAEHGAAETGQAMLDLADRVASLILAAAPPPEPEEAA